MTLTDRFGRPITYLRISVTDRCNLRCVYCLPEAGVQWQPREDQLSAEEIACITEAAARGGVKRVRLTGGEPLVRPDILEIVARLSSIPGIEEVSLTTNAMLLERLARPLAQAGLRRVNISLDTLDPDKFKRITRGGDIDRLWRGIAAAEDAGLAPLKLNTVVVNGLNADELPALARLTIENPWHIRFIELMPVGNAQNWGEGFPVQPDRYISVQKMQACLSSFDLHPVATPTGNGPARTFCIPGALGTVGFISPLGEHFCQNCNRLRLTADGYLRPCLLLDGEVNIREAVRTGKPLLPFLQKAVDAKPQGHELLLQRYPESRRMAQIGG
ncbi:MAG TPA: GTP 3',8-cyclase MoaA [Anaerolineales bacterium]|nr:GTP 3',8-cyclase MoaA [Anaerolineales bacterium]